MSVTYRQNDNYTDIYDGKIYDGLNDRILMNGKTASCDCRVEDLNVSKLVFYAHSTSAVISGRGLECTNRSPHALIQFVRKQKTAVQPASYCPTNTLFLFFYYIYILFFFCNLMCSQSTRGATWKSVSSRL